MSVINAGEDVIGEGNELIANLISMEESNEIIGSVIVDLTTEIQNNLKERLKFVSNKIEMKMKMIHVLLFSMKIIMIGNVKILVLKEMMMDYFVEMLTIFQTLHCYWIQLVQEDVEVLLGMVLLITNG